MPRLLEVDAIWNHVDSSIGDILDCLEGMSAQELNWRPAMDANSLFVLATHTLGSTEEAILEFLRGVPVDRHREAEFQVRGESAAQLRQAWEQLRARIEPHLDQLTPDDLAREYVHPRRGPMSGHQLLTNVLRHAAEHHGHAELTRDLIRSNR